MMSSVNHDEFAHLKIPLEDVISATNNFDDKNFRGEGGFGNHYQGQLLWSGELIDIHAQRWIKEWDEKEEQFWMEILMLSSLKHKNVVSLVGFCDDNDEKIIIIKLETMFSLDNYLEYTMMLTWVRRLEICVGLAHSLSYIHYDEHRDFSVIHRNIDSETVVINDNFEPKLSEFRLSMKIEASRRHHSFHVNKVWDIEGYTDPTYVETFNVSHKSDIYSFGIVMFELLCGRRSVIEDDQDNKYLASVAVAHYREKNLSEIIDWNLLNQMDSQSFNVFAEIAYDCLNEERSERPNIDEIVPRLEKALKLQMEHHNAIISSLKDDLDHLKIPFEMILSATNNIGTHGINCPVYKGQLLRWQGHVIDFFARRLGKYQEGGFWMEISLLSSLKHKNLVSLVGFCDENDEKIIIYRRETRGSLFRYLRNPMMLTWVRRLEISVGIAQALSYIYYDESRDFSVIHRNISRYTVQLNDDWEPKLSNFEYSMKIEASQRHHLFRSSTLRYVKDGVDPTYIETKSVNHKSDMYSFGILLIELLCGRIWVNDNHLTPLFIGHYREKKLDNLINRDLWVQMDLPSFNMFAEITYECLDEERSQRPNIDDIVPRLEKALELARENRQIISSLKDDLDHLKIPFEMILSATNNFRTHGINNALYKPQLLRWHGHVIDIFARRLGIYQEGEFWREVSLLSSLKHKNLVSLVGFCDENDEKIIIYRRQTRGSLFKYLRNPMMLRWVRRLEISVGIAHALSYIHYDESRDFSVIHRNISRYTVLLNDDWEPKLSNFEYSMKIKASERHHSFHANTLKYVKDGVDPTYIETKSVNHKSDMYSFGILLIELLCSRIWVNDNHLAPLFIGHYREKKLDNLINRDLWVQMDLPSFNMFAEIAYECLDEERSQRPNIDDIVPRLEKVLELARENRQASGGRW